MGSIKRFYGGLLAAAFIGSVVSLPPIPSFVPSAPHQGFTSAPPWLGSRESQKCGVPFGHLSKNRRESDDCFDSQEYLRGNEAKSRVNDSFGPNQRRKGVSNHLVPFGEKKGGKTEQMDVVHVVIFNSKTEDEGVHTVEFPKGSGIKVVLAFESGSACEKFSGMLRKQNFSAVPLRMKFDFLKQYCATHGVFVEVVPKHMDIKPPATALHEQREALDRLLLMDAGMAEGALGCDEDDWTMPGDGSWQ